MTNSMRTQQFLRFIAKRLSGREDCKQVEFRIGIGELIPEDNPVRFLIPSDVAKNYIFFQPDTIVFRDMHHRSGRDKFRIVDLILHKYFPELIKGQDDLGNLIVDTSKLVKGVYIYQKSYDGSRRRWVRMARNRY